MWFEGIRSAFPALGLLAVVVESEAAEGLRQ